MEFGVLEDVFLRIQLNRQPPCRVVHVDLEVLDTQILGEVNEEFTYMLKIHVVSLLSYYLVCLHYFCSYHDCSCHKVCCSWPNQALT